MRGLLINAAEVAGAILILVQLQATLTCYLTVCSGQLSLLFLVGCLMSTNQWAVMLCSWGVMNKKGKVFPYLLPSVGPELIPVYRQSVRR